MDDYQPQQQAPPQPAPQPPYYYYGQDYYQPKPKKPVWPWIALAAAVFIGVLVWALVSAPSPAGPQAYDYDADHIAVLPIRGTMTVSDSASLYDTGETYNQQFLTDTLDGLIADESNLGLLLYIDSPGGEVVAASELGDKIKEYREATGRPVYAYGHAYAASGGYWVAAPADRIILNRYCTTGSIGVTYGTLLDISGLLARYGVETHTITSGAQKAMGSSFEPMSEETEAIFQAIIDEYYGYFLNWVSENRGIDAETLRPLADGRIYTAKQAVENGLADEVGSYDDAVAALQAELGVECEVITYEPPAPETLLDDLLPWLLESGGDLELNALLSLLPPRGPLAYYSY